MSAPTPPTVTLRFEGYSDDTFGETLHTKDDYDNCASGDPIRYLVGLPDASEMMVVSGQYAPEHTGGWLIGVAPCDSNGGDKPIPPWPMRIERGDMPYSVALIIEAPSNVQIRCLERT